ncbi:MAG: hypothetical protein IT462_00345 [Planctomycetes bacterium]|nr:hypothetical protein [Planctomycetota bacterium]
MRRTHLLLIAALALLSLAGCAEYKEYVFKDFQVSREEAYNSVVSVLAEQGYEVVKVEEIAAHEPEVYLESKWNLRQTGSIYPGNNIRRRAYVKVITRFTDRAPEEFQPLAKADKPMTAEERKAWDEKEEARKKGDLEITRIGVAIRREKLNDIRSPADFMEADWVYQGPDELACDMILGDLDLLMGAKRGAGDPSERIMEARRRHMAGGSNK